MYYIMRAILHPGLLYNWRHAGRFAAADSCDQSTRLLLESDVYGSFRLTGEARVGARTRGLLQVAERTLVYEDRD